MKNSVKNRVIVSGGFILLGFLLIGATRLFFPECNSEDMKMACYYTAYAERGLGILIVILGIAALAFSKKEIRGGISIAQIGVGILVFLYPLKLIGLCKMADMDCRVRLFPAIIVIGVLFFILAAGNSVYLIRKDQGENDKAA